MPDKQTTQDWRARVRDHLQSCGLPQVDREEVVSELATHLEESYEAARSQGLTEEAAADAALQEVNDWRALAAKIRDAKSEEDPMNTRTKSLWLPAMTNLLAAMSALMVMQKMGAQPRLVWVNAAGGQFAMALYLPWLMTLPLFGAAGAYMARRTQGDTLARLASGLSPGWTLIGLIAVIAPWGLLIDGLSMYRLEMIAGGLFSWGVLPTLALLIGTAPFLRESPALRTRSTT
jgi:hypothetical protein